MPHALGLARQRIDEGQTQCDSSIMKLYGNALSPYARKAMILWRVKGLAIEELTARANGAHGYTDGANPVGKIPALARDGRPIMVDSPVICEYLDSLSDPILPPAGEARWDQLRLHALGDAISDATYNYRYETVRSSDLHWPQMVTRHETALVNMVTALEQEVDGLGSPWEFGNLSIICALDYMGYRAGHIDWRALAPSLARWHQTFTEDQAYKETYGYPIDAGAG